MTELFRDIALSFCPARVRHVYRPQSPSTVLRTSLFTGIFQTVLCTWGVLAGYKSFVVLRTQQFGQVLNGGNETTQLWFGGIFFVEYILFHPLALLLAYLALEGFVRFVAAVCVSEVVPSLPVSLVFVIDSRIHRKRERKELDRLSSIPDAVEVFESGDRIRVASALPKPTWNASITIEIREKQYEVEREERGVAPRVYVYWLRRAPIGKILRGYERYSIGAVTEAEASDGAAK